MNFCMFHYFISCNSVNDPLIMALHVELLLQIPVNQVLTKKWFHMFNSNQNVFSSDAKFSLQGENHWE